VRPTFLEICFFSGPRAGYASGGESAATNVHMNYAGPDLIKSAIAARENALRIDSRIDRDGQAAHSQ